MSPINGEIKKDYEIGKGNKYNNYIWLACPDCQSERWVKIADTRKPNYTGYCHSCGLLRRNGKLENSPNWKGGIKIVRGYVEIMLMPEDPFFSMAGVSRYVKRSRLIMAKHLGRCLKTEEEVHHEDENRSNDELNNLRLFPSKEDHIAYHRQKDIQTKGLRPINDKGQYLKGGYHAYSGA